MAEISFLHFPEDDHDHDHDLFLDDFSPFDSWPHNHADRKNQVSFVMDLFHQRLEDSTRQFGLNNAGFRDLEIELGFVQESSLMGSAQIALNHGNYSTFRGIEEDLDGLELELGFVGQENVSNETGFRVIEGNLDCLEVELGFVGQENGNEGGIVFNESGFRVIERNDDVGVDCLEVELGFVGEEDGNEEGIVLNETGFRVIEGNHDPLEVELVVGLVDQENDDEDCNFGGFAVSECGEDFYIARRNENVSSVWIESDSEDEVERIGNVMMRMHLHSDDEDDFALDNVNDDGGISLPLCWDSFHLEEEDLNHDFEWEEVDDGVDPEDEEGSISVLNISGSEEDVERGNRASNLEWEVLLNHVSVDTLSRNLEMENEVGPYFGDHDDYEMMFGQFADGENAILGKPPASKSVVENLPSVVITKENLVDEKSLCAVCKDHIEVGEKGKELPCFHRYHGECITPWLEIRNTCPVCRFELATDDPDYEERKARRSAHVA